MFFDGLIAALATWVILLFVKVIWKSVWEKIRRKRVWVIDDSQIDLLLYENNLKLREYDVKYFSGVKGLAFKLALDPPDTVLVDYRLQDNVDGDQVYKACKRNGIRCFVVTGHDGDIKGVDRSRIIRKEHTQSFYRTLENLVRGATA